MSVLGLGLEPRTLRSNHKLRHAHTSSPLWALFVYIEFITEPFRKGSLLGSFFFLGLSKASKDTLKVLWSFVVIDLFHFVLCCFWFRVLSAFICWFGIGFFCVCVAFISWHPELLSLRALVTLTDPWPISHSPPWGCDGVLNCSAFLYRLSHRFYSLQTKCVLRWSGLTSADFFCSSGEKLTTLYCPARSALCAALTTEVPE